MKKNVKIAAFVILLSLTVLSFSACGLSGCGKVLSTPENLQISDAILTWDTAENAGGYVVSVDGDEDSADTNSYDLSHLTEIKTYQIKVKAVSGENYSDSSWSEAIPYIVDGTIVGAGTQANPYKIATKKHLMDFRDSVNGGRKYTGKYITLLSDINLDGDEWTPIGIDDNTFFEGSFNGGGFEIKNFIITSSLYQYVGLFGYCRGAVEIKNLGVTDFTINASNSDKIYAGGLAGGIDFANSYTIENSYATGNITATSTTATPVSSFVRAGGLIGYSSNCTIKNSYATGNVTTNSASTYYSEIYAGGLIGEIFVGTIKNSYATGNVTVTLTADSFHAYAGGLIGETFVVIIEKSYRYAGQIITRKYGSTIDNTPSNTFGTAADAAFASGEFYISTLGWSTDVWDFSGTLSPASGPVFVAK